MLQNGLGADKHRINGHTDHRRDHHVHSQVQPQALRSKNKEKKLTATPRCRELFYGKSTARRKAAA